MVDTNVEVLLKDVRLSFFDGDEPKENKNDEGQVTGYSQGCNLLVKKTDTAQIDKLKEAMKKALEATWAGQAMKIPPERRCVRDGEPQDPDTNERAPLYEGYEGCFFVSAKKGLGGETREEAKQWMRDNPTKVVQILGSRKGEDGKFPRVKPGNPEYPYAGCYVDAVIRIYGYDGKKRGHPNRINASLEAIKFKRHGEAFGAKPIDADAMFESEPDDELTGTTGGGASDDTDDMLG